MRTALILLLVVVLPAAGIAYYVTRVAAAPSPEFRTAIVQRANLLATISATGTVEPEEVVDVGAQVAGRILSLGVDAKRSTPDAARTIDYGSIVEQGTVLAIIDDAVYDAQRGQAQAALSCAEADLLQAEANRALAGAKLAQADAEWKRAQRLRPDLISADTSTVSAATVAAQETAKPVAGPSRTRISCWPRPTIWRPPPVRARRLPTSRSRELRLIKLRAVLQLAETNLGYTVIKSPVQGVIVDRRVNIGQTVVSTLNAPSLFLIAKDLARMQVWASVNEADIGRLRSRAEIPVQFTVDAYPNDVFRGKIAQIRLNATMTQNVVDVHGGCIDRQFGSPTYSLSDCEPAVRD